MYCLIKKVLIKIIEVQIGIVEDKIKKLKYEMIINSKECIKTNEIQINIEQDNLKFLFDLRMAFI